VERRKRSTCCGQERTSEICFSGKGREKKKKGEESPGFREKLRGERTPTNNPNDCKPPPLGGKKKGGGEEQAKNQARES